MKNTKDMRKASRRASFFAARDPEVRLARVLKLTPMRAARDCKRALPLVPNTLPLMLRPVLRYRRVSKHEHLTKALLSKRNQL